MKKTNITFGCCITAREYADAELAGFDFVELAGTELYSMPEEQFAALCAQIAAGKIPCIAVNSYCGAEPAIVGEGFDAEKTRRYAKALCARAAKLGVKMIGIGAPAARTLPEGYEKALANAQCREFLRITAETAKTYGIRVNYESLNSAVCNYGICLEEAVSLVRSVGMENLSLVVDFYHRHLAGEALYDFAGFEDLIFHTHISTCGPRAERGFPGMDELSYYREILHALRGVGYRGGMSVEAQTEDLLREGRETLRMLRLAGGD